MSEPDTILVHGLEVPCYLGVPEEERAALQTVRVDLELETAAFPSQDHLDGTVDYHAVALAVKEEALKRPRLLLETMAQDFCSTILDGCQVSKVTVRIRKKVLPDTEWVGVQVTRSQQK